MPDLHWWRPLYGCRDFGVDRESNGVAASAEFRCHDPDAPEWWAPRWRWHIDGRPVLTDAGIDPMPDVRVEREGNSVNIYAWDRPW